MVLFKLSREIITWTPFPLCTPYTWPGVQDRWNIAFQLTRFISFLFTNIWHYGQRQFQQLSPYLGLRDLRGGVRRCTAETGEMLRLAIADDSRTRNTNEVLWPHWRHPDDQFDHPADTKRTRYTPALLPIYTTKKDGRKKIIPHLSPTHNRIMYTENDHWWSSNLGNCPGRKKNHPVLSLF